MATTTLTGTSVASASIKIFANGTEIVSAATTTNNLGVWSATIPAQTIGTKITAKAISGNNTISIASNEISVTAEVSGSSGSGSSSSPVNELLVADTPPTANNDYLLIVGVLVFLLALFLFFKKIKLGAIAFLLLAVSLFVTYFSSKK